MSHIPGRTLEALASDTWMSSTPELERLTVEALEPHRADIELLLEGYDDEEHSWRDYRNSILERYRPQLQAAWDAYQAGRLP